MFDNKFLGRFMNWRIYLSGEIHTNWRDELKLAANEAGLNVEFLGPETVSYTHLTLPTINWV